MSPHPENIQNRVLLSNNPSEAAGILLKQYAECMNDLTRIAKALKHCETEEQATAILQAIYAVQRKHADWFIANTSMATPPGDAGNN